MVGLRLMLKAFIKGPQKCISNNMDVPQRMIFCGRKKILVMLRQVKKVNKKLQVIKVLLEQIQQLERIRITIANFYIMYVYCLERCGTKYKLV